MYACLIYLITGYSVYKQLTNVHIVEGGVVVLLTNRRAVILWSLRTWWPKLRSHIRWLWCTHCPESMRSGITSLTAAHFHYCLQFTSQSQAKGNRHVLFGKIPPNECWHKRV